MADIGKESDSDTEHSPKRTDSPLDETKPEETDDEIKELLEKRKAEEEKLSEEVLEERRLEAKSFKESGNGFFSKQDYESARNAYTDAIEICPLKFDEDRAPLFANRAACFKLLKLHEAAIADCSLAIKLKPDYVRCIIRRGELYEITEKYELALEDFKRVLELDPSHAQARHMCSVLPQKVHEQQEKLKAEMMGQLKQLGNMVLKPFGLSTDNFKMQQDPSTGGYSINFQR